MVISRDPGFKFWNCYLLPNSVLNFRKIYQIWAKLAQEQKTRKAKNTLAVENTPPPHSSYRINISECKSLYSKMQLKFECISNASIVIAYYIFFAKINVFYMYLNLKLVKPGFQFLDVF